MASIVYGIRDKQSNLYFYVGSTKHSIEHRWDQHLAYIRYGYNKNRHFVSKLNKVGIDNVAIDILCECDTEDQFSNEATIIQSFIALGHPLTNKMHNPDVFITESIDKDDTSYINYELRLDHLELILNAYLYGVDAYTELGKAVAYEIEQASNIIIEKHWDEFVADIKSKINHGTNSETAEIYS